MKLKYGVFGILIVLFIASCARIKDIQQSLVNLKKLEFKLDGIRSFNMNGINLSRINSIDDFSITDGMKLLQMFNSKKLPCNFVLDIAAKNPNDGTGSSRSTKATITNLDWVLFIDNKQTISGAITQPIEIPGTGKSTIIPISINIDLYEFFAKKGYDDIINLALALGGVNGSTSRVRLDVKPTVSTPFGPISYPGKITVIDKEFRN